MIQGFGNPMTLGPDYVGGRDVGKFKLQLTDCFNGSCRGMWTKITPVG